MKVEMWDIEKVKPYGRNPRINEAAVEKVRKLLDAFGWRQPIVVDKAGVIVAGDTRWRAAKARGDDRVPVHVATDLSPEQVRAWRIADNRVHQDSSWDDGKLGLELKELGELGVSLDLTGFDTAEIDKLLGNELTIVEAIEVKPLPTMAWVLVGIPTVRYGEIAQHVEAIAAMPDVVVETTANG